MAEVYAGWEGSLLWKAEVTAGTAVVPDTALGYVKNVQTSGNSGLEEEGAVGTWKPARLEEGVLDMTGSCEFMPINATALGLAARNASTGKLSSYSIHATGGGAGVTQTGVKVNQFRGTVDAGGRLRCFLEWMALSAADAAAITAVVPTDPTWNWAECAHSLSGEIEGMEFTVSHNVQRVPVIPGSGTTLPVTGVARSAYRLVEGRQSVRATMRFFARPSQAVIDDVLTEIASMTLIASADGFTTPSIPQLTFTFTDGKPVRRENSFSEDGLSSWPLELAFKNWTVAYALV